MVFGVLLPNHQPVFIIGIVRGIAPVVRDGDLVTLTIVGKGRCVAHRGAAVFTHYFWADDLQHFATRVEDIRRGIAQGIADLKVSGRGIDQRRTSILRTAVRRIQRADQAVVLVVDTSNFMPIGIGHANLVAHTVVGVNGDTPLRIRQRAQPVVLVVGVKSGVPVFYCQCIRRHTVLGLKQLVPQAIPVELLITRQVRPDQARVVG